ncbi:malate dehydrogenase [Candidatus Omnitrophota bacterium]
MKISIIGAGQVGAHAAMRIAEAGLGGVVLVDIVKGLAKGKSLDLEDAAAGFKSDYRIEGTDDLKRIKDSDIVVVTAGLARKPGMSREELIDKNSEILKSVCAEVKKSAPAAVLIIVTNPLDMMTYLALKNTGFKPNKVFGMGVTLDAARFTNQISRELNVPNAEIEATVIGSHGKGMLPLSRFTRIKDVTLDKFVSKEQVENLVKKTVDRGAEIVSHLGSGSAYFAPSVAIMELVRAVVKDEKRVLAVSAYLDGEYGLKGLCIGVPCRLGRTGIEGIVELKLNPEEKAALQASAKAILDVISKRF